MRGVNQLERAGRWLVIVTNFARVAFFLVALGFFNAFPALATRSRKLHTLQRSNVAHKTPDVASPTCPGPERASSCQHFINSAERRPAAARAYPIILREGSQRDAVIPCAKRRGRRASRELITTYRGIRSGLPCWGGAGFLDESAGAPPAKWNPALRRFRPASPAAPSRRLNCAAAQRPAPTERPASCASALAPPADFYDCTTRKCYFF